MRRVMVRYQVEPGRAAENERHVAAVFAELAREAPPGIRYATFRLADGVSFVHLASIETDDDHNPLLLLDAFRRFSASIGERCAAPPVVSELHTIGAYRLLDAPPGA